MAECPSMAGKLDAFLYGSCVSRDLQELSSDWMYRRAYVARQSLISATTPPYIFEGDSGLDSAWQHRMVLGDLSSNLLNRLSEDAARSDLLIWDLTDERMGVQPLGDGSYGTITPDSLRSGILEAFSAQGDPVDFGTPEHLELWKVALDRFLSFLDSLGMHARTYALRPHWAGLTRSGERIDAEGGRAAEEWARDFEPYVESLARSGITVLALPEALVRGDDDHRWGVAPYHYVGEAYRHWSAEIYRLLGGMEGKRAVHEVPRAPADGALSSEGAPPGCVALVDAATSGERR